MHSAVGSYVLALWWGWKLSSVVPGEKDSPTGGLHAELFVLQGEKIPRQVGLDAELFILPGEKDSPTGGAAC